MRLQESGEMYLESILMLTKQQGTVRSIDISLHLGYSKPSVSRAVGNLKKGGYILVDDAGLITLTDTGMEIAQKIFDRHMLLRALLVRLGVDPQTAAEDACKMEHAISDASFEAIIAHIQIFGEKI